MSSPGYLRRKSGGDNVLLSLPFLPSIPRVSYADRRIHGPRVRPRDGEHPPRPRTYSERRLRLEAARKILHPRQTGHTRGICCQAGQRWTFTTDELDIAPVDGEPMPQPQCNSTQDLLDQLSRDSAEGRKALLAISDADLMKPWSLKAGGKEIMTMPKIAIYRGMIMNHLIHHRAQITVYLRLRGVPLPSLYGPTADEPGAFGPPA